jgi:hypothetical protein
VEAVEEDVLCLEIAMDRPLLTMEICEDSDDLNREKTEGGLVPSSTSSIPS